MTERGGLSAADELLKLTELRDKGVLTAEEFEKQKQAVLKGTPHPARRARRWYQSWWLRIPLLLVSLFLLISSLIHAGKRGADGLPMCDSSDAQDLVKNAIEKNAAANVATLRLLSLDQTSEISHDDQKLERMCNGRVLLNAGEEKIRYRLFKRNKDDDSLFVEVTELQE